MWLGQIGELNITDMIIDMFPDAKHFKSPPYREDPKTRIIEQDEIDKRLKAGVIESYMSEWEEPVLFVAKKDGKLRFFVDYRKLHTMDLSYTYLLLCISKCIDTLGDAKFFTTLDAYFGYWQMKIRNKDRPKTAFVFHVGTFQCVRMTFCLTNSPACFQRAKYLILTKYKWKTCLVYVDDVIIFSNNVDDYIKHVDKILKTLVNDGVMLKINKWHFFQQQVEYLGHMVEPDRL